MLTKAAFIWSKKNVKQYLQFTIICVIYLLYFKLIYLYGGIYNLNSRYVGMFFKFE